MADFGEQAFLLDFINYFPNFTTQKGTVDVGTETQLPLEKQYPAFPYNYVMRIQGEPEGSINKLKYGQNWPSKEFDQFAPHQLSYLTPKIEIYKTRKVEGKWIEIPFPINVVTTADSITNSLEGRGTDVALKSITWQDTGTDTAYAGITMKGQIGFTFQSFESLFMDRPTAFGDETIGFYELTTNVPSNKKHSRSSDVQMAFIDANKAALSPFEIKIVVGWSEPNDPNNEIFDVHQLKAIREAVTVLNVTTNRCNITLGNGGKVDLSIEFTGRLETAMYTQKYDLFMIDTTSMEAQVRHNSIRAVNDIKKQQAKLQGENENDIESEKGSNIDDELEKAMNLTTQTLYSLKSKSIQDAWSGFLSGIMDMKGDDKETGRIFSVSITKELYDKYETLLKLRRQFLNVQRTSFEHDEGISDIDATDQTIKKYDQERQNAREAMVSYLLDSAQVSKADQNAMAAAVKNADNTQGKEAHLKSLAVALSAIRNTGKIRLGEAEGTDPHGAGTILDNEEEGGVRTVPWWMIFDNTELFKVNFFFLGDLFEAAMNIVINRPDSFANCKFPKSSKTNPSSKKMADETRLMLGTIKMANPDTGELRTVNIADIPISVNSFSKWFEKSIILNNITALPLRKFISEVATSLVGAVLGVQAESRSTFRSPSSNLKLVTLELPEDGVADTIWKKFRKELDVKTLIELAAKTGEEAQKGKILRTVPFLYLYTKELPIPKTKSAMQQLQYNVENGIPHLYVGNNTGMVKQVTFTRTPIAGHQESSILRAKREGITFKSQLLSSDKYDISLQMYGNSFYKPGMQIYLDPQSLGLGYSVKAMWAQDLGLGGHYSIIGVENTIKGGHYETKIAAKSEVGLGLKNYSARGGTRKSRFGGYGNVKDVPTNK